MIVELSEIEFQYLKCYIKKAPVSEKHHCLNTVYVLNVSADDASDMREEIADDLPSSFDHNGEPTPMAMIIESLIDKLDSDFLPRVCYKAKQDNLRWESPNEFVFEDKEQIIEWGNSLKSMNPIIPTVIFYEEFQISDNEFFLLLVEGGSRLHNMSLYVLKKSGDLWTLQTESHFSSTEMLVKPRIDSILKKVLFETAFGQIGELPFELLL